MYPHEAEKTPATPAEAELIPPVKTIPEKEPHTIPANKEQKKQAAPERRDGLFGGLFDGLSVDDLVLFGLLLVLLLGDGQDSATVLAVVFVMLLT